ncbi:MAG: ZIP family metal transporter [Acidobacteria bacterium]|nr:ZIP family metal transporter [Acidobacteriota bacterium]
MEFNYWSLLFGLLAAAANIFGGWVISTQKRLDRILLTLLVAIGAGFMLAATLLKVIPESFLRTHAAPFMILAGYLFIQFAEHTLVPHFHFGEETHGEEILRPMTAQTALVGLVLHTFFDGVLIASGFLISTRLGILLFLAIFLHKIPEGFTVASIMRAAGKSRRKARFSSEILASSTLLGILSISVAPDLVKYALPFSAGVTLYVAASDLIPEVNREESSIAVSLMVFLGVLIFFGTELLLSSFAIH